MLGAGCLVVAIYTNRIDAHRGILAGAFRGKPVHKRETVTTPEFDEDVQDLLPEHVGPGDGILALRHDSDVDGNVETKLRLGGLAGMLRESSSA